MNYGWVKISPELATEIQTRKDANPGENFPTIRADIVGDKWMNADLLQPCNWTIYPVYVDILNDLYNTMVNTSSVTQLTTPSWPPEPEI